VDRVLFLFLFFIFYFLFFILLFYFIILFLSFSDRIKIENGSAFGQLYQQIISYKISFSFILFWEAEV